MSKCLRNSAEVTDSRVDELYKRFSADGLSTPSVSSGFVPAGQHLVAEMLDVRMLFSALVDADYLETEADFEEDSRSSPTAAFQWPIARLQQGD